MARVHPFQTNFTAGELTPKLAGQVDFKKYNNGVETLENMTVFPQGGATRRYGSRFVAEVKDSSKITRLIPFEFNIEQSYILEFGDQYIRFFKDNGQITNASKNITNITQANPAVVTVTSHGYSNGDDVWINNVGGMTELNGRRFRIANVTANTFELSGVDSTGYTAYTSGGTSADVYEIASPFTESMLYDIQFTQSADVMYIVQETLETRKLSRTGHTSWTLSTVEFINGPYLDDNESSVTFTSSASGVGTGRTLTASASTFVCSPNETGFHTEDIGRSVRLNDGWGVITAYISPTQVTWEIKQDIGSASASKDWALGAWSEHTGYPKTVSFFEQRLVFGGSTAYPQTIWASESGFYEHFHRGAGDPADAFIYTIAANKVNVIRWLAPARDLVVGTAGGEFKVGRPTGEPLQPDNVQITQQTTYGGYNTQPIQIGNSVLFVQRQRKKIREFSYRFEDDAYLAQDMTLLSEHITGTGITDVDYAQEPDSIYWAVRDDGTLLGLTYQREEDIVAWHRHILGGSYKLTFNGASDVTGSGTDPNYNGYITITSHGLSTGDQVVYSAGGGTKLSGLVDGETYYVYKIDANNIELASTYEQAIDRTVLQIGAGVGASHTIKANSQVKSVATISEPTENQVWIIVRRRINGNIVQYVEYLDPLIKLDSGLTGLVNGNSTSITGLDHLEGETVQILIGDAVYPNQTVTNGSITVGLPANSSYKSIEIGLGYTSKIKTMRIEAGSQAGTAQGRKKRYNEVMVRLHKTVGIIINGDQLPFRTSSTPMGQNIQEFTGDKRVINLGWDRDGQIQIEQQQPLPMTVLGITGTLVTTD
jgi:hypothetical protein